MPEETYLDVWNRYQQAVRNLSRSLEGATAERGSGGAAGLGDAQAEDVLARSERLGGFLREAVAGEEEGLRELAGLKLLAAAAYDLSVADDWWNANGSEAGPADRAAAAVRLDPQLRRILELPLDRAAVLNPETDREALPVDAPSARARLEGNVRRYSDTILADAAEMARFSGGGIAAFGLGPAQQMLSIASAELLTHVPEAASLAARQAARLLGEALRKLWGAYGDGAEDEVKQRAESWLKELLEKGDLTKAFLGKLYGAEGLTGEAVDLVRGAPAATPAARFNQATRELEDLLARYAATKSVLHWIVRGVSGAKPMLLGALPWGPMAAYGFFAGTLGYAVYSAGDYLDAHPLEGRWLDRVQGLRSVVVRAALP